MATFTFYNPARLRVAASTGAKAPFLFNASASATWKLLFVNGYTFNNDHSARNQITNEVTAANYQTLGVDLQNITWTLAASGTCTFDAADTIVTASATAITADGAVLYYNSAVAVSDGSTATLFAYVNFSGTAVAGDTTIMKITWNAAGLMELK